MRLLLFLILTISSFAISISTPSAVATSSAAFTSLSNTNLTTHFLTCDSNYLGLWAVSVRATTAATVDVCKSSNAAGVCQTAGDVTSATKRELSSGDIITLGYTDSLGSVAKSEMTTFTKFSGSFVVHRYCVPKDFIR